MTNEKTLGADAAAVESAGSIAPVAAPHVEPEIVTVELDPDVWLRGNSYGSLLSLHNGKRRQCCIGVACTHFGVSDSVIAGQGCIQDLPFDNVPLQFRRIGRLDSEDGTRICTDRLSDIYAINDDPDREDSERVHEINQHLAKLKASFRFKLKAEGRE